MSKEILKVVGIEKQNGVNPISGEIIKPDFPLIDTHRITPRCKGGNYEEGNYIITDPVTHMKEHGNWRERSPEETELKALFDSRQMIIKGRNAINNEMLAFKRKVDNITEEEIALLESRSADFESMLKTRDKQLKKFVRGMNDPVIKAVLSVPSVGEITAAACKVYFDPEKAQYPSSYVKYAGLHCASRDRYKKNEAGGGNKWLRCVLWNMAKSQVRQNGPYRVDYDRQKIRRTNSEKMTMTNITGKKGAHQKKWCECSKGHIDGDAIRKIMKLFICHYWLVERVILGHPITDPYPIEKLGHKTIIRPEDRGWKY